MINLNQLYGDPHRTMTNVVSYVGDFMTVKRTRLFANLPQDVEAGSIVNASGALFTSSDTNPYVVLEPFVSAGSNKYIVVHETGAAGLFFKAEGLKAADAAGLTAAIALLDAQPGVQVMFTVNIPTT
ncbi:hypothetical protein SerAS12_1040 [Serratia sp. AS12]|uniref:hypothetical protein n=1 Tax=Serratia TaxID=613 RepID=UPI00020E9227|nr:MULTISPECIES: hypothetical protein [Serratia]AEF44191.1 hypothetical protein SerAS9_1040 [Serratia plymuthica AS9]AEF49143.1 hypothetical protein SerAS12_1040 [Serratia sp. AS12]AEG26851.1 hypothetical protein SerAS13_1040 [Serratia sp. AS13]UTN97724.1 hypothetical protein NLX81_05395 [Serratia plymuthica]